ncbi:hypothetical protein TTRE_0000226101 [Trichuris trichiura]|uniref:Uncharacterized protein n=1 Tax=Trichuris trichiura TaxID=36087 RepID=A0A077Z0M5_TRITR|nr:hypothetical protein TTRE_0000226101 [Trichuris trichiura]
MSSYGQLFEICPGQSKLITNRFGQPTRCLPHRTDLCSRDAPAPSNTCCYRSYGDYFCCAGLPPQLCPTYENVTSIIYKQLYADGTSAFPFRRSLMNKRFGEYNNIIRNGDRFASFDEQSQPLRGGDYVNGPPGVAPPNGVSTILLTPPRKRCQHSTEQLEIENPSKKGKVIEAPTTLEQPSDEDEFTKLPMERTAKTDQPTTTQLPTLTAAPKGNDFEERAEKSSKPEEVKMEYANRYDNMQSRWLHEAYNSWLSRPPAVQRQLTTVLPTYSTPKSAEISALPKRPMPYKGRSLSGPPDHFRTIYDQRAQPFERGTTPSGWIKPSQLMRRHVAAKERARRAGTAPSLFNFDLPKAYHRNVKPSVAVSNVQKST